MDDDKQAQQELTTAGVSEQTVATTGDVAPDTVIGMLQHAVSSGMPVETIERLMAMRDKMRAEWARDRFFAALSAFQSDLPTIHKSKQIKDKSGKVRSSYAPLEQIIDAVKPLLLKHGFSYTLKPVQEQDGFTAHLIAHHKDGHEEETTFTVPIDNDAYMNAPQKVGSARTYALRYAFCNAFGIMTSDADDDANGFDIDAVLSAKDEIDAMAAASTIKALRDVAAKIRESIPEGDARRPILAKYYEERKNELRSQQGD